MPSPAGPPGLTPPDWLSVLSSSAPSSLAGGPLSFSCPFASPLACGGRLGVAVSGASSSSGFASFCFSFFGFASFSAGSGAIVAGATASLVDSSQPAITSSSRAAPPSQRLLQLAVDAFQRFDLFADLLGRAFGADAVAFVGELLDRVEVGGDLARRFAGQQLGVFGAAGGERERGDGGEPEGERESGRARHRGESRERPAGRNFPASERHEPTRRRSPRRRGRPAATIDAAARSMS